MADFIIGDYQYYATRDTVRVQVVDTTKSSYESLNSTVVYDGLTYTVTNMRECFKDCTNFNQSITIPNSVTNMSYCFENCTSLNQSITIPGSVTDMAGCFNGCTSLNQPITIPNSVIYMDSCFNGCTSFNQSITIPGSVTNLTGCFAQCTSFNQLITIPNSVTDISYCFYGCVNFNQSITIPNSVTNLNYCFSGCTSFNQPITIPNSVTVLTCCFENCTSLNQPITIPNSVTVMSFCFNGCTSFNQLITIPNSVIYMDSCFRGCTSFNQPITIPNSVNYMDNCFKNCTSLTTFTEIPVAVQSISSCFANCSNLTGIINVKNSPSATSGTVFSGTQKNIVLHVENSDGVGTWKAIAKFYPNVLALEANVDFIDGDYACQFVDDTYGANYPESFDVTTTGTTINGVTSSNCIATISVEKTSSEINIKLGCSMKLTNSYANTVSFTNSVEAIVTINELALTNVSIETPLGTIGGNATKTVSNSSIIATLPLDSTVRYISGTLSIQASGGHNNSVSFSLLIKPINIGIKAINTSKVTYETIPASIVYDNARYFVTNLNITDSDDSIIGTFSDCVNLNQNLTIPQYVKNMDYCFSGCSALDNTITFVNDCTVSSMKHSFENCFSLNQLISLPATIDEIDGCFDGCVSLSKVYVTNSPTTYEDLFNNTHNRIDLLCQDITYLSDWESITEDYPNVRCSMPAVMDLNGIDNAAAFGKRMFDADRLSFYWKTDVHDTLDIIENSALQNALEQLGWNDIII